MKNEDAIRKPAAGPWQPGATAPKDGRVIIGKFHTGKGHLGVCIARYGDTGGIINPKGWLVNDDGTYTIADPVMWAELYLPEEDE